MKVWNTVDILKVSAEHLEQKGFENPRLNAEQLLAHVLKIKRIDLYLNFERPLAAEEIETFRALLKRRLQHEPLQYLLEQTEFMSLPFYVDSRGLIPRPETEILVETVLHDIQQTSVTSEPVRILDIGTGSGNIAVSLAKNLPETRITALDVSAPALELACQNAQLNEVSPQITFIQGDIASFACSPRFDWIVSNPPYISKAELKTLAPEIINYEPLLALDGGIDGLNFYRIMVRKSRELLVPGGKLIVEIGARQGLAVQQLFAQEGFEEVKLIQDLNHLDRVVYGRL